LYNNPGEGLTISLTLPKIVVESEQSHQEDRSSTIRVNNTTEREVISDDVPCRDTDEEKQTLLLVEDDKEMLSFICRQLERDYLVQTAGDGNEGIAGLEKHEVNLIITDLMMPNMDGITFCRTVKTNY